MFDTTAQLYAAVDIRHNITQLPLTCDVAEGPNRTQELVGITGACGTVAAHGTNCGGVVQHHDAHGVVAEVASWALFA